MRKMNPDDVKNDLKNGLITLTSFYSNTSAGLELESQRTFLTENSLMAAAVLWESFISDLLVAYINSDSTQFAIHLENALNAELSGKQATILRKYARLSIPAHLTKAQILELVDGNGNNITFSNFGALADQTSSWLVLVDSTRFSKRTDRERSVVNALIAVRNHLAHRSKRSHDAMNDALATGALHLTGLKRGQKKINYVGAYLKAIVPVKNVTRLEVFLAELQSVAMAL